MTAPMGAGRIIAGSARGIRLQSPGDGTRPLGDRAKETLFAILEPDLPDARVLDLFAGSGAAGLESLSRGAGVAVFVDDSADACRVIARNLEKAHLSPDRARIVRAEVGEFLHRRGEPAGGPFDIVIVDPPYADDAVRTAALARLGATGSHPWVRPGGRIVITHARRYEPPATIGLVASERQKRFGETMLTFYRRSEDA